MPRKKSTATAENSTESTASPAPATNPPQDGKASVIAALVAQGYSYDEAVAMLSGDGKAKNQPGKVSPPSPGEISEEEKAKIRKLAEGDDSDLPPVEDVPDTAELVIFPMDKREGHKTLLDDYWNRRGDLEEIKKKARFQLVIELNQPELDWLLHRTIREGQIRKDAEFSVNRTLTLLLKQQKALDNTYGAKASATSSGPRENYNPATGGWTKAS